MRRRIDLRTGLGDEDDWFVYESNFVSIASLVWSDC